MLKQNKKQSAFTIVELLVVIVVIAILAAITIVSYTNISQRAINSSLESDLVSNSKLLKMYYVDNGYYPTFLDTSNCPNPVDTKYCLKPSEGNDFDYTSTSTSTYKLVATKGSTSYYVTENSSYFTGGKNILSEEDASFETGIGGWVGGSGIILASSTENYYHRSHSMKVTRGTIDSYVLREVISSISPGYHVYQFRIKGTAGKQIDWGTWNSGIWDHSTHILTGNWDYLQRTLNYTTQSFMRIRAGFLSGSSGDVFYIDAVQLEKGSSISPF